MKIEKIEVPELLHDKSRLTIVFQKGQNKEVSKLYAETFIDTEKEYTVKIEPVKKKRSIPSNNYAWVLMEEIGNVLRTDKEEVYIDMLKRYGQIATDGDGNKIIFSVKDGIDVSSYYKYVDKIGVGYVGNEKFNHYRVLKGSSEFDSKEMSIFIDGIVSEAKDLGIETKTPDEIKRMTAAWKGGKE